MNDMITVCIKLTNCSEISEPMQTQDLYCVLPSTLRHTDVVVGGRQRCILLVNVDRGSIVRKVS
jgi:hypothetical protein